MLVYGWPLSHLSGSRINKEARPWAAICLRNCKAKNHIMSSKKKTGWLKSIIDFCGKYNKAIAAFAAVAGVAYTLGYKTASVFKEREIMNIENRHSAELLNLKEEYMDKYYTLREQQFVNIQKDSTDENKSIQRNN